MKWLSGKLIGFILGYLNNSMDYKKLIDLIVSDDFSGKSVAILLDDLDSVEKNDDVLAAMDTIYTLLDLLSRY